MTAYMWCAQRDEHANGMRLHAGLRPNPRPADSQSGYVGREMVIFAGYFGDKGFIYTLHIIPFNLPKFFDSFSSLFISNC